jgi:serine/threonine protein kinase
LFDKVISAGAIFTASVVAFDSFGNPTAFSDDAFECRLEREESTSPFLSDGANRHVFSRSFQVAQPEILHVYHTLSGEEVAHSPFHFTVSPGAPSRANTKHNAPSKIYTGSAVALTLQVVPADAFKNVISAASGFQLNASGFNSTVDGIYDLVSPDYSATIHVAKGKEGTARLVFLHQGEIINNGDVTVELQDEQVALFDGLSKSEAGTIGGITLAVAVVLTFLVYRQRKIAQRELLQAKFDQAQLELENIDVVRQNAKLLETLERKKHTEEELEVMKSSMEAMSKARADELKGVLIDSSLIKLGKIVGKGGFGVVMQGVYKRRRVAVKQLKIVTERRVERFRFECFLMKQLRHPNIVRLVGVCWDEHILGVIMEFAGNGTLHDWLERTSISRLKESQMTDEEKEKKTSDSKSRELFDSVYHGWKASGKNSFADKDLQFAASTMAQIDRVMAEYSGAEWSQCPENWAEIEKKNTKKKKKTKKKENDDDEFVLGRFAPARESNESTFQFFNRRTGEVLMELAVGVINARTDQVMAYECASLEKSGSTPGSSVKSRFLVTPPYKCSFSRSKARHTRIGVLGFDMGSDGGGTFRKFSDTFSSDTSITDGSKESEGTHTYLLAGKSVGEQSSIDYFNWSEVEGDAKMVQVNTLAILLTPIEVEDSSTGSEFEHSERERSASESRRSRTGDFEDTGLSEIIAAPLRRTRYVRLLSVAQTSRMGALVQGAVPDIGAANAMNVRQEALAVQREVEDIVTNYEPPIELAALTWKDHLLGIAIDAAQGLRYMHQQRYFDEKESEWKETLLHRDIKPANMLLTRSWTCKLTDFGESRAYAPDFTMTMTGTPLFIAPEVMRGERYSEAADIYSLGVTLLTMVRAEQHAQTYFLLALKKHLKRMSQFGMGTMLVNDYIVNKGWRPAIPVSFRSAYPALAWLIDRCLFHDPAERPGMNTITKTLQGAVSVEVGNGAEPVVTWIGDMEDELYELDEQAAREALENKGGLDLTSGRERYSISSLGIGGEGGEDEADKEKEELRRLVRGLELELKQRSAELQAKREGRASHFGVQARVSNTLPTDDLMTPRDAQETKGGTE